MIKEKARELAAAIKETEEFKGLQSARARVKLDPTAFDLLTKLQQTQARIIGLQQQGQPITQEIVEELRTLEKQMQLNLTLRNGGSPTEIEDMMDEVNQVLAENLGWDGTFVSINEESVPFLRASCLIYTLPWFE